MNVLQLAWQIQWILSWIHNELWLNAKILRCPFVALQAGLGCLRQNYNLVSQQNMIYELLTSL